MQVDYPEYVEMQSAFVLAHGAPHLITCARAIEAGIVRDMSTVFTLEDWALCPAFLPIYHSGFDYLRGAWIADPVTGELEVISILREYPAFTGAAHGRTGLRLLVDLLDQLAGELDGDGDAVAALVDFVFADVEPITRKALVDAVAQGFDPHAEGEVRALPLIRDLWTDRDTLEMRSYAQPLPEIFARNEAGACTAEDFARPPSRRPAFEEALSRGDIQAAWALLNRSGWHYEDVLFAGDAIGGSLHPSVRTLLHARLRSEVFAPTEGY